MLNKLQLAKVKVNINDEDSNFPLVFQAMGDPGRFKIFKLLMDNHNICVTDVANIFGITVSAASQQLRVLERLGLVLKLRAGQMVCYEINRKNLIVKQLVKLFYTKKESISGKKGRRISKKIII